MSGAFKGRLAEAGDPSKRSQGGGAAAIRSDDYRVMRRNEQSPSRNVSHALGARRPDNQDEVKQKKRPHPKMGPNEKDRGPNLKWWQMDEGGGYAICRWP
jgi:hypothetical protein